MPESVPEEKAQGARTFSVLPYCGPKPTVEHSKVLLSAPQNPIVSPEISAPTAR
jgi:hypothetical protein